MLVLQRGLNCCGNGETPTLSRSLGPAQLSSNGCPKLTNSGCKCKTWLVDGPSQPYMFNLKHGRGERNQLCCEQGLWRIRLYSDEYGEDQMLLQALV